MSLNEWVSGTNKEPLKKDIRKIENKWVSEVQSFEKKLKNLKLLLVLKVVMLNLKRKFRNLIILLYIFIYIRKVLKLFLYLNNYY